MRSSKTTQLRELLRDIQVLSGRKWAQPELQRHAQEVLGPLGREVSLQGLTAEGTLVVLCQSTSAKERAQALESLLLAEFTNVQSITIRKVEYRIDIRAGRAHVPERLTRQLRPVSPACKQEIADIASGLKDEKLRATFQRWMTTVAQLEQSHDDNSGDAIDDYKCKITAEKSKQGV